MLGYWNSFVRRARIGRQLKHAALTISSYANNDGTSIKCGVSRLAADCEVGYSTARRYLAWLREVGLIELVAPGSRAAKRADEYRLIVAPAALTQLDVPDEAEYRKMIEGGNEANQASQKARRMRNQRSPIASADAMDHAESSALTQASADTEIQRSFSPNSALTLDEPLPLKVTSQLKAPPTGGAPPPDPRRPEPPPSSGSRLGAEPEISAAHHPAQDLQRNSRPHASARAPAASFAPVVDFFTREVS